MYSNKEIHYIQEKNQWYIITKPNRRYIFLTLDSNWIERLEAESFSPLVNIQLSKCNLQRTLDLSFTLSSWILGKIK